MRRHYTKLLGGEDADIEEQGAEIEEQASKAPIIAPPSQLELERAAEEAAAASPATTSSDAPDTIDDRLVLSLEQITLEGAAEMVSIRKHSPFARCHASPRPHRDPPCHAGRGRENQVGMRLVAAQEV